MPNARHGSGIYLRSTEVPSRFGTRASDRGEKHARLVNSVSTREIYLQGITTTSIDLYRPSRGSMQCFKDQTSECAA